jgi:hypothetical protein
MSMRSLTTIAAQRNQGRPQKAEPDPREEEDTKKTVEGGFLDVLVAAIPTEPLALYTFLAGVVVGTIDLGESQRLGLRWGIYVGGLVFVAAWLISGWFGQRGGPTKSTFPAAELSTASVAFAAWGLVMPQSPLAAELSGDNRVIWTAIITVVGVALLGLQSRSLQKSRTETASAEKILSLISAATGGKDGKTEPIDGRTPAPPSTRKKPHGEHDERERDRGEG